MALRVDETQRGPACDAAPLATPMACGGTPSGAGTSSSTAAATSAAAAIVRGT